MTDCKQVKFNWKKLHNVVDCGVFLMTHMEVYVGHGVFLEELKKEGLDTYGVTDIRRAERLEDLKGDDKLRYDSDIKAVNILLLGLPIDIYTLINHYQTAKEIWDHVKELMEGT
ncbi:hypothetical protein Tco_0260164 [Tanacetum coccineum]